MKQLISLVLFGLKVANGRGFAGPRETIREKNTSLDIAACLRDESLCNLNSPLVNFIGRDGSGLLACLDDPAPCTSVSTSSDASGSFETPHPYENSGMYMFEVELSESDIAAGKQLHWSFDEFEVDIDSDGVTCNDEVYVFTSSLALGPFCGFDDAFNAAPITISNPFYDYYYYDVLNTHNLGNMATGVSQAYSIKIGIQSDSTVRSYGFKFTWSTTTPTTAAAGPRKRKVQKKLNFVAGFAWNAAYSDKTSTEYLGIKSTMLTFVTALFQNLIDQHGYTITIDLTISEPGSRRKRRDGDGPGMEVDVELDGDDSSGDPPSGGSIDTEVANNANDAINNYDSSTYGDLIDTSVMMTSDNAFVINSVNGAGCWTCNADSYANCILEGSWQACPAHYDPSGSVEHESICYVELRERGQQMISIATGCIEKAACRDLQAQNTRPTSSQSVNMCKPEFKSSTGRFGGDPSVCRQCFNACDLTGDDTSLCFGGMSQNIATVTDAEFFGYPTSMANSYWTASNQLEATEQLGIPIGAFATEASDVTFVEDPTNKVFWGGTYQSGTPSKDSTQHDEATQMVYWGLQDQASDFWASDLINTQDVYASRGAESSAIFTD